MNATLTAPRATPRNPSTLPGLPARRAPKPVRRHLRHLGTAPGGVHFFACHSASRPGMEIIHAQEVDLETFHARCSCEAFRFNHAMHEPTLNQPDRLCRHLKKCVAWLVRHDLMPATIEAQRCIECGMPDAPHALCDDNGNPIEQRVCDDCLRILRARAGKPAADSDNATGDELSEPAPEYAPEVLPEYAPDDAPEYEPEYSEPAGGRDFDVRR